VETNAKLMGNFNNRLMPLLTSDIVLIYQECLSVFVLGSTTPAREALKNPNSDPNLVLETMGRRSAIRRAECSDL